MSTDEDFAFNVLDFRQFEEFSASVVQEHFKISLISFSEGKDGGRDAVARNVTLQLGTGKLIRGRNVVVQAKHTKNPWGIIDNSSRARVFEKEIPKVHQMVKRKELDIYIAITNYGIPAGQEQKIVQMFRKVGCRTVIVVGRETLVRWIRESQALHTLATKVYGVAGQSTRQLSVEAAEGVKKVRSGFNLFQKICVAISSQFLDYVGISTTSYKSCDILLIYLKFD